MSHISYCNHLLSVCIYIYTVYIFPCFPHVPMSVGRCWDWRRPATLESPGDSGLRAPLGGERASQRPLGGVPLRAALLGEVHGVFSLSKPYLIAGGSMIFLLDNPSPRCFPSSSWDPDWESPIFRRRRPSNPQLAGSAGVVAPLAGPHAIHSPNFAGEPPKFLAKSRSTSLFWCEFLGVFSGRSWWLQGSALPGPGSTGTATSGKTGASTTSWGAALAGRARSGRLDVPSLKQTLVF